MSQTQTFSVPAVHCGHCQMAIEDEVGRLDGVERVEVDLDTKLVTVAGDAQTDAIVAAIDEAGYEATPA